jgi:hypothetical protein
MADEPNSTDTSNTTPATSTGGEDATPPPFKQDADGIWVNADGSRIFTKEDYDKGMSAARKDGEERARKKLTPQTTAKIATKTPAKPSPASDDDGPAPVSREELDLLRLENSFHRLDVVKRLSEKQATRIFKLAVAEGVEHADLADYVAGAVDDLGISLTPKPDAKADGKTDDAKKGDAVDKKTADLNGAAKVDGAPGKVNALDVSHGGLVDVSQLTEEQCLALGPAKIAEYYEAALAAHQQNDGRPQLPAALRKALS